MIKLALFLYVTVQLSLPEEHGICIDLEVYKLQKNDNINYSPTTRCVTFRWTSFQRY